MGEQLSPGAQRATNIVKGDDDDHEAVFVCRGERRREKRMVRERAKTGERGRRKDCLALKCIMVYLSWAPHLGRP